VGFDQLQAEFTWRLVGLGLVQYPQLGGKFAILARVFLEADVQQAIGRSNAMWILCGTATSANCNVTCRAWRIMWTPVLILLFVIRWRVELA